MNRLIPDPAPVETTLVKLAGLKATIDRALAGDVKSTGTSVMRSRELLGRFSGYREELREADPILFGDLPDSGWYLSIANQTEILRQVDREIEEIFIRAGAAGLKTVLAPPVEAPPPADKKKSLGGWLANHLWQIISALLVAYLVFRFGWNK